MSVDTRAIASAVSGLPLVGNEEGLIPAFGLYLTRHYADYYNRAGYHYLHSAEKQGESALALATSGLIEAGHQCAFNTFGGIMLSQEWDAVVKPMLTGREDWVSGIVGVINALGWGAWKVEELVANKKLVISVEGAYETVGYMKDFGRRSDKRGVCFLANGGVAGIMNLLYHGDIIARPALTASYYTELFATDGAFSAEQTASVVGGDSIDRFVATRTGG